MPTAAALTRLRAVAGFSAEASGAAVGEGQGAAGRYTAADYHRAYASGAVTPLQVPVLAAVLGLGRAPGVHGSRKMQVVAVAPS